MRRIGLLLLFPLLLVAAQPRTILGIYNSEDGSNEGPSRNNIHLVAQMPLNYLGLNVRVHDIAWGLPTGGDMDDVFAILVWCRAPSMINAESFTRWLAAQANSGMTLLLFGELPFLVEKTSGEVIDETLIRDLFRSIGLDYIGDTTSNPLVIEVDHLDPEMVGFERPFDVADVANFVRVVPLDDDVESYLTISRSDQTPSESVAVCITPKGGYTLAGCALYKEWLSEKSRWFINPFLYFNRALRLEGRPRFDTTTLFGKRIFYSHIDGDGLRNESEVPGYVESGDVILKEIIRRYPLPITASFITAEVNTKYAGNSHTVRIAKAILVEKNVETAAHGFTHPLDWDRGITVFSIPGYSQEVDQETIEGASELSESGYKKGAIITAPEREWHYAETAGAAEYINDEIAPENHPTLLTLWTGNCKPPPQAIQFSDEAGLLNLNGGDGRLDRAAPTYTAVAPLIRTVGDRVQIYTSNANDNIYTNLWTGPFYGQVYVIESFEQMEIPTLIDGIPRRVAPMNLYYHYYSGEKEASLYAIRLVYDYILQTPCIPIFASRYCRIVNGFIAGKIDQLEEKGWRFSDYSACQTVRFDDEPLWPDLERSKGVLGFRRWENFLYIHLTENGVATLYLSETEPTLPYLIEASAVLQRLKIDRSTLSFEATAIASGSFAFANLSPNSEYRVTVTRGEKTAFEITLQANSEGRLEILVPLHGTATVSAVETSP